MNKRKLAKPKGIGGITLIALVITIIVLLILAGVSIATLTGENGILTQANNAKMQNEIEEEKEQIRLAWNAAKIEAVGGTVTAGKLKAELISNGETGVEVTGTGSLTITMPSGNEYIITTEGKIEEAISGIELLKKYLLGSDEKGLSINVITNLEEALSLAELKFIGNEVIEKADEELIIQNIVEDEDGVYAVFLYKVDGLTYKVYINEEWTTTKVVQHIEKVIYEGDLELTEDGTIIEVTEKVEDLRIYNVWLEVNGELTCITCEPRYMLVLTDVLPHIGTNTSNDFVLTLFNNESDEENRSATVGMIPINEVEIILKKIVDTEVYSDKFVQENGFIAMYNDAKTGCYITETPGGEYVIPDTVSGVPVEKVYQDALRGTPTFIKPVGLSAYSDPIGGVDKIIVTSTDGAFASGFFSCSFAGDCIIDVSQAGDDIEISDYFLANYTHITVYVNETVKAKYESYTNIMLKID